MLSYAMAKVLAIIPFDLIIVSIKLDSHLVFVVRMMNSLHVDKGKEKRGNKRIYTLEIEVGGETDHPSCMLLHCAYTAAHKFDKKDT